MVLFDGVCNFCNASINFVIDHDPSQRFRFAALQSEVAGAYLAKFDHKNGNLDSVILIEGGKIYEKSDAALRIARHLRGWQWAWALRFVPRFFRDAIYGLVARNRYAIFGKTNTCRMPTPADSHRFIFTTTPNQ